MVAGVPVVGVDNVIKVIGRLAEERVDGINELEAVLGCNSIDSLGTSPYLSLIMFGVV